MDVVKLLPDSVANQIAAGEVVQRPASVVKELMENSVDAGATLVKIIIKSAGKQSIQVIDNGCGMSETDARLAFERHATSKIRAAEDLFGLHTMGFRGEALASIAAVAQVQVKTRREEDKLGVVIDIEGSKVTRQEPIECQKGTQFTVSNLFYNIPVRRNFLQSDRTEMKCIVQEFQRVALAHQDVAFKFYCEDELVTDLMAGSFRQRVKQLFGKSKKDFEQDLIPIEVDTNLAKIDGFVGRPETAGKNVPQYFLANNRFIVHRYFRNAVIQAYERMISADVAPMFFINITVDPQTIDVNIHPTKTEVKFENEREIYSIITVAIRNALGKFNISPTLEFDTEDNIDIPVYRPAAIEGVKTPAFPKVHFDQSYDPFKEMKRSNEEKQDVRDWQSMFDVLQKEKCGCVEQEMPIEEEQGVGESIFYKGRWLCVAMKGGLNIIDVSRAIFRIEYDKLMAQDAEVQSEQLMFDEILDLNGDDMCLFSEIEEDLRGIGFQFEQFSPSSYRITSVPVVMTKNVDFVKFITNVIDGMKEGEIDIRHELQDQIVRRMAQCAAQTERKQMAPQEREVLISKLFQSSNPNNDPSGKPIIQKIDL